MPRHGTAFACSLLVALGAAGCPEPVAVTFPLGLVQFPVGIVADPCGDYLYVVNSNFDIGYEGGSIAVLDLATSEVVSKSSVQIASFAGLIAQHGDPQSCTKTLYVTSRQDQSVTWITVDRIADAALGRARPMLSCWDGPVPANRACEGSHIFGGLDVTPGPGASPFAAIVQPPLGLATAPDDPARLVSASFDGTVSVLPLDADGRPPTVLINGTPVLDSAKATSVPLIGGLYGLAVHPRTRQVYATTKAAPVVFPMTITAQSLTKPTDGSAVQSAQLVPHGAIAITNQTSGREFGRGITFNAAGTLAFVAYRSPPSLVILDTTVDTSGHPENEVRAWVALGDDPAAVAVAPTGPSGQERVYVTSYGFNRVHVIDPERAEVVDAIEVGDGPFDLAYVSKTKKLYVSLFEEGRISVIDCDPVSRDYHDEVARIR